MYQPPDSPPSDFTPAQGAWLLGELRRIADGANQNNQLQRMQQLGAAPEKPQNGDLASANGTTWMPGAPGLYEYRSGAWAKL
ncbi:MAG: hypothetical protein V4505_25595 [Pseudomonadota bacterium]